MTEQHPIKRFSVEVTSEVKIAGYNIPNSSEPLRIVFTDGENRYEVRFDSEGNMTGVGIIFNSTRLNPYPTLVKGDQGDSQ